jgi:hypothetical protein
MLHVHYSLVPRLSPDLPAFNVALKSGATYTAEWENISG